MKKYSYIIIIFLFFLFPNVCLAVVSPTKEFYINDYANILSDTTEEYILQRSLALNEADGTQIVVVTVSDLDGMSLEEYANELFNSFEIGDKDKNNGLLLLLALEERAFRVEVGDGLAGILPDGKTGRFQDDYIIPYLKEDDWDNGIKNGYDAFYSEIVEVNNLNVDYSRPVEYYVDNEGYDESIDIFTISLPVVAILGVVTGSSVKNSKEKKKNMFIFLGIWGLLLVLSFLYANVFIFPLIFFLIFFLGALFSSNSSTGVRYYGGRSSRSHHSSRSSFRGFSGGGGRSRGGGSSRRF